MWRYVLWFVLWIFFAMGSIIGGFTGAFLALFYPLFDKHGQNAKRVEAVDRMIAAYFFGCSGRWTISVECAHEQRKHLKFLRAVLDKVDKTHCEFSAYNEGAFCEIPRKDSKNESA